MFENDRTALIKLWYYYVLFVFLYFTYMTFKLLNNIVAKEENLKKKNYKKL